MMARNAIVGVLHKYLWFFDVQCHCHRRTSDAARLARTVPWSSAPWLVLLCRRFENLLSLVINPTSEAPEHDEHATALQTHDAVMSHSAVNNTAANHRYQARSLLSSRISRSSSSQDRPLRFENCLIFGGQEAPAGGTQKQRNGD